LHNPFEIGFYQTPEYATELEIRENLVFLVCGRDGLLIIDIGTPQEPVEIGSFDTQGYARDVALRNNIAFIADDSHGIRAIDISNPEEPIETGYYDSLGEARSVFVTDDLVFAAEESNLGIYRYDGPEKVTDSDKKAIVEDFILFPVFPNPFNSSTNITCSIPHPGNLSINLYGLQGRNITGELVFVNQAGRFNRELDLSDYPTGVYILEMGFESVVRRQKLVLIQ